jgi:hypothetical protein
VVNWEIVNTGPYWQSNVALNRQLQKLLNTLDGEGQRIDAEKGEPLRLIVVGCPLAKGTGHIPSELGDREHRAILAIECRAQSPAAKAAEHL